LTDEQLLDIIDIVKETQIAGLPTNTTISREGLSDNKAEMGVCQETKRSTEVIRFYPKK
jgi:dihydroorotate dehydrogenase